jgi:hypothetical protein
VAGSRPSLGGRDVSDRLLIPEKLYGREREVDALLTSFHRVVANSTSEFVRVSGYSGIGMSSVVERAIAMHLAVWDPPRSRPGSRDSYPTSEVASHFVPERAELH